MRKRRKRHLRREGGQVLDERTGRAERRIKDEHPRKQGDEFRGFMPWGRRAYDSRKAGE